MFSQQSSEIKNNDDKIRELILNRLGLNNYKNIRFYNISDTFSNTFVIDFEKMMVFHAVSDSEGYNEEQTKIQNQQHKNKYIKQLKSYVEILRAAGLDVTYTTMSYIGSGNGWSPDIRIKNSAEQILTKLDSNRFQEVIMELMKENADLKKQLSQIKNKEETTLRPSTPKMW